MDAQSILAEADALDQTAADLMARASRLRAIANAAPGAPSGPSASELPPYDPDNANWAPPGRAAEKVGVAISTMRTWIADDIRNRFHRRIGKGRIYVYLPALLGGDR